MELARPMEVWQPEAACKGPYHEVFYPPTKTERRRDKRKREARAKEICLRCPVIDECREYSFTVREQHGIWGGLTENERNEIWKLSEGILA